MKRLFLLFLFFLPCICFAEKALFSYEEYSLPITIGIDDFFELENGSVFLYNGTNVFQSNDAGRSWTNVTQSNSNTVWGCATDGKSQIYISAGDFVQHSSDAGQTWEQLLTEIAPYSYNQFVLPDGRLGYRDGKNICIFKNIVGTTQIYSVTFALSNVRLLPNGSLVALDTNCNVWTCDSLGGQWTQGQKLSNAILDYTIPIAIGPDGKVALLIENSVFCSNDYGKSWLVATQKKSTNHVLRFAPNGILKVLSNADSLLSSYSYDGTAWQRIDSTKLPMLANTFYLTKNGDMYVATFQKELYRREKGSNEWTKPKTGLPIRWNYYVEAAANKVVVHNAGQELIEMTSTDSYKIITLAHSSRNYTFLEPDADTIVAEYGDTLFCSRDGGQTWGKIADSLGFYFFSRIARDFSGRYFRVSSTEIVWTTDCGRNWKKLKLNSDEFSEVKSACLLQSGKLAFCNSLTGIMCFDPTTESITSLDTSMKNIGGMADIGNNELLISISSYVSKYNLQTKENTEYLCLWVTADPVVQVVGSTWYAFSNKLSYFSCDSGRTWQTLPTPNTGKQKSAAIGPDGSVYSIGENSLFKLTPHEGYFRIQSLTPDSVQFIGRDFVAEIEHKGIPTKGNCEFYYWGGMFRLVRNDATIKEYETHEIGNGASAGTITGAFDRRKMLILFDNSCPIVQINSDKKYLAMPNKKVSYCRAREIVGEDSACVGQMFELNAMNLFFNEMPLLWLIDSSSTLFTFHDAPVARLAIIDTGLHSLKLVGYSDTTRLYSDTIQKWIYVRDLPAKPSITRINDTTLSAPEGAAGYQWYLFTVPIEGATSRIYQSPKILDGGFYTVTVEDASGCISPYSDEYYNPAEDDFAMEKSRILANPNPASTIANIRFLTQSAGRATVSIVGLAGITVLSAEKELSAVGHQTVPMDVSGLPCGLYFVSVSIGTETFRTKLIIQR